MKKSLLLLVGIFLALTLSIAQPVISFQTLATGFSSPVDVVSANDGTNRLFVVEKSGTIRIWDGTSRLSQPFLDIRSIVKSTGFEQGLLSLAFHPNYNTNGYFFVYYTNQDDDVTLARYTRTSLNTADPTSGVVLMTIYKPFLNHNGADLNFGSDGYLYFATGDGGSGGDPGNRAQNGDTLLGKMIRIDVNNPNPPYYSIPPTNPYVNNAAIRDEIIALGLRNPWRWSFDRQTGDMWIADVGQTAWEEVNFTPAASILNVNYGWSCVEGNHTYKANCGASNTATFTYPIFEYPHNSTTGGFSITGGFVYRGTEYPALQGYYITSDYVSDHGWLIRPDGAGGWSTTMQSSWAADISSYGEDENGNLYAVSLSSGTLYKIIATSALPVHLVSFKGTQNGFYHELNWEVQNEEKGDIYILEKRTNQSEAFTEVSRITSSKANVTNKYSTKITSSTVRSYYRLQTKSIDGRVHFSNVVMLENKAVAKTKATIVSNTLQLSFPTNTASITIIDAAGKTIMQKQMKPGQQTEQIPLNTASRGILSIRFTLQDKIETVRVVY